MAKKSADDLYEYSSLNYNKVLGELAQKTESRDTKFDPQKHKDETRSKIALTFTRTYFGLIALVIVGIPIYNILATSPDMALNLKDTLLVLSSIIGGPFGFVVGYYFKGSEK